MPFSARLAISDALLDPEDLQAILMIKLDKTECKALARFDRGTVGILGVVKEVVCWELVS